MFFMVVVEGKKKVQPAFTEETSTMTIKETGPVGGEVRWQEAGRKCSSDTEEEKAPPPPLHLGFV